MILRSLFALALASFALAASADTASGGSISYTGPTDFSTQIGYLAKFNPNAGTLTGVSFTVGYGFNSTITVSATADSTGNVRTESALQFDSSDAAVKSVLNSVVNTTDAQIGSSQLAPAAYDLLGNRSVYSVGPTFGNTSAMYTSTASASNTYAVGSSDFGAFVANPNSAVFDVYGTTLTGLILSATGGNASAFQNTNATASISVLYTYQPVPEPGTYAALGLGAVAVLRRRKRA